MRDTKSRFLVRKRRVRNKLLKVSSGLPRLSVFKSNKHIYAQIIDDKAHKTLVAANTLDNNAFDNLKSRCNVPCAIKIGELIAAKASEKGILKVVFDKGGYKYHGVVKALADSARGKLEF